MAVIAAIVFIALYFVEAGYGMLFDKKWGFPIPNKIVFIMERIGTPVRDSTAPDILVLRAALFPTVFYFSFADKRQK